MVERRKEGVIYYKPCDVTGGNVSDSLARGPCVSATSRCGDYCGSENPVHSKIHEPLYRFSDKRHI